MDDARAATRYGGPVDERREVLEIGGHQVALLESAPVLGRGDGDSLLDLVEKGPWNRPAIPSADEKASVLAGELARRDDDRAVCALVTRAAPGNRRRRAGPLGHLDRQAIRRQDPRHEGREVPRAVTRVVPDVDSRARGGISPGEPQRIGDARNGLGVEAVVEARLPPVDAKTDDVRLSIQRSARPSRQAPRGTPRRRPGHRAPCARWSPPMRPGYRCRSPRRGRRRARTSPPRRAGAPWHR